MDESIPGHLDLSAPGDSVMELLAPHPSYRDEFLRFHHTVIVGDGPLPHHIRHYIAIMAACRHRCSYLIEENKCLFLENGGPPSWLDGVEYAPAKMQALHTTNKLLAHRPWMFQRSHIKDLLSNSWSLSEVTQALCILAHFHSLCSLVYGTGLEAESTTNAESASVNIVPRGILEDSASASPTTQELSEGGIDVLLERMQSISQSENPDEDVADEQISKSFDLLKCQHIECEPSVGDVCYRKYEHFSPEPEFTYINFGRRKEKNFPTLTTQDCSWEDHGFSLLSELYCEVGDLLDKKFETAFQMTYFTCGTKTHVDTLPFRKAVWNYLHCLFGIRYCNYDYRQVNRLLEPRLKDFLKVVSCFPERLGPCILDSTLMKDFLASERIHVLILIVESRLQAELLYALRAIGKYVL